MQIFVRDLSGTSHSFDTSSPSDLLEQVHDRLDLSPSSSRLSYRSRQLPSATSSLSTFDDYNIPNYATMDLSLRLPGGGPKKRCAHVFAPVASTSGTTGASAVATKEAAKPVEGQSAGGEKKEGEATVEVAAVSQEALVGERCTSAALRMVGECPRCEKNYCGAHRLPEDHACPALSSFRKAAFDENKLKLEKEATFASKISAF